MTFKYDKIQKIDFASSYSMSPTMDGKVVTLFVLLVIALVAGKKINIEHIYSILIIYFLQVFQIN